MQRYQFGFRIPGEPDDCWVQLALHDAFVHRDSAVSYPELRRIVEGYVQRYWAWWYNGEGDALNPVFVPKLVPHPTAVTAGPIPSILWALLSDRSTGSEHEDPGQLWKSTPPVLGPDPFTACQFAEHLRIGEDNKICPAAQAPGRAPLFAPGMRVAFWLGGESQYQGLLEAVFCSADDQYYYAVKYDTGHAEPAICSNEVTHPTDGAVPVPQWPPGTFVWAWVHRGSCERDAHPDVTDQEWWEGIWKPGYVLSQNAGMVRLDWQSARNAACEGDVSAGALAPEDEGVWVDDPDPASTAPGAAAGAAAGAACGGAERGRAAESGERGVRKGSRGPPARRGGSIGPTQQRRCGSRGPAPR
eukprot:TRINITY_DN15347_c0_g2_i1.p1 TRINITY_DN15347_c0_g2~~TRINITY_DN15347_c0_g2_i1.p1  ORF type:complete len:388 (+),score=77.12 TRINITY_DN15347_c0_g2_i1:93-1166(+)